MFFAKVFANLKTYQNNDMFYVCLLFLLVLGVFWVGLGCLGERRFGGCLGVCWRYVEVFRGSNRS